MGRLSTTECTYPTLHLGRFGRPRALPPKWAHANIKYCKKHTLLATHGFGGAPQASLHEG